MSIFDEKRAIPFITDGIVKSLDDDQQMGRAKVWCPAIDGENYEVEKLPWAEYSSPFGGITTNFPVGRKLKANEGTVPYGFWSIPKINARVLVFFLNGEPNRRVYFGSLFPQHGNRGLPHGRNLNDKGEIGPWTDTFKPLEPAYTNLRKAFANDMTNAVTKERGGYNRQVAQAKTNKDGKEGYYPNVVDNTVLDPQMYCWVTPGHNSISMSDQPDHCRITLRTTEGAQVILDDSNGRIYISTARGGSYVEINETGNIHVYSAANVSIRSGKDINFAADGSINLEAKKDINLKANANLFLDANSNINISAGGSVFETACGPMHITASALYETAKPIHHNGPKATPAGQASSPSIVPNHEPWSRP